MVVGQLASLGGEAQICHTGDGHVARLEAQDPLVFLLELQFQLQALVLEVRQTRLGRDTGATNAARRATGYLVRLAVVVLVVWRLAVTQHGHHVGEDCAGAIVFVGVKEDAETLKVISRTEDGAWRCALLREPHGHAVAVEVPIPMNLKLDFDLQYVNNIS